MILITGADGQLGRELQELLKEKNIPYKASDVGELDITDESSVNDFFEKNKPSLVYNCAAYTAVDKAEDEGKLLNEKINIEGTQNIARACARVGAKLVQISTDYVFGGHLELGKEWQVDDEKTPVSEYGRAKDLAEKAVITSGADYYIIRTAWLYGAYGPNFVFTMQKLAQSHKELTVVNDQHGRPTWSRTLAEFMLYLVEVGAPVATYQLTNDAKESEDVTWYDFAKEIFKGTETIVRAVSSEKFQTKAKRPFNSTMSLTAAKSTGFKIPLWQEALAQMLEQGDLRENKDLDKGTIHKK
ncbi:MAG: dTDP-4-dehydrorhamnose reductase [Lactovum sp.]